MAKIAAVISSREVAFNQGSNAGVNVGDRARIVRRVPVADPESGEQLGVVARVLATFEIEEVEERISVGSILDRVSPSEQDVLTVAGLRNRLSRLVTDNPARATDGRWFVVKLGQEVEIDEPEEVEGS